MSNNLTFDIRWFGAFIVFAAFLTFAHSSQADGRGDAKAGLAADRGGDHQEAIRLYSKALQSGDVSKQDQATIYLNRGAAFSDTGQYGQAIADYDESIRLRPDDAETYVNRGIAHRQRGEYDLAIADYDKAINLKPDIASTYNYRGLAYSWKDQYDRAIADYNKAIGLNTYYTDAYINRGAAFSDLGQYERAIADFNTAIRIKSDYVVAYNDRGIAYRQKGQNDQAITDFNEAIRINPDYALAYFNRGLCRFTSGQFSLAASDFAQSVKLDPSNAYGILWLHVARSKIDQADVKELSRNATKTDRRKWPGPVIDYYLGQTTSEQLREFPLRGNALAQQDQVCQTIFFIGEYELLNNHFAAAKSLLQQAVDTCSTTIYEHMGALSELRRMKK